MKLIVIIILFPFWATGQQTDSIKIVIKQEKYYLTKTCYDFLYWEEVLLKDSAVASRINSQIRKEANTYLINTIETDMVASRCAGELTYEQECNISYAKNGLVSCAFTAYTYFEGAAHGERDYSTMNFETKTGDMIGFMEMFNDSSAIEIKNLLWDRLAAQLQVSKNDLSDILKAQADNPYFEISDEGITVEFIGDTYVASVIEVFLSYGELISFIKSPGFLDQVGYR